MERVVYINEEFFLNPRRAFLSGIVGLCSVTRCLMQNAHLTAEFSD